MSRNYEWCTDKQRENLDRHGVDFADLPNFDWEGAVTLRGDRQGETQFIAYGYVNTRPHAVVLSSGGVHGALSASAERAVERCIDIADGYSHNGLTAEEFAALPPYEKVATMTFAEIEKIYGEETAIHAGIATDRDAWVPQEADFSKMRPIDQVINRFKGTNGSDARGPSSP